MLSRVLGDSRLGRLRDMRYIWASATHKGMVRDNNEDSIYPTSSGDSTDSALVIVADGMGGHVAGEVCSMLNAVNQ
jgi:protein phosphatase